MAKKIAVTLVLAGVLAAGGRVSSAMEPPQMVAVKGGCFEMGDTFGVGRGDEQPVHEVCVGDFQIGKYEVTQEQWQAVMGSNPSKYKGPQLPVEHVSWNDAQEFISALNQKTGLSYRLPTEAEWEYAARSGGKKEKWAGTSDESQLANYAWYGKNSLEEGAHVVGKLQPNGLGLYDMSGNVLEWCSDWYKDDYYQGSPKDNPKGPDWQFSRVGRGGGWNSYNPWSARAAGRIGFSSKDREGWLGFRLTLPAAQTAHGATDAALPVPAASSPAQSASKDQTGKAAAVDERIKNRLTAHCTTPRPPKGYKLPAKYVAEDYVFVADICMCVKHDKVPLYTKTMLEKLQKLNTDPGYCYTVRDPEIYDAIDCVYDVKKNLADSIYVYAAMNNAHGMADQFFSKDGEYRLDINAEDEDGANIYDYITVKIEEAEKVASLMKNSNRTRFAEEMLKGKKVMLEYQEWLVQRFGAKPGKFGRDRQNKTK